MIALTAIPAPSETGSKDPVSMIHRTASKHSRMNLFFKEDPKTGFAPFPEPEKEGYYIVSRIIFENPSAS
jgi:hypothetical protein